MPRVLRPSLLLVLIASVVGHAAEAVAAPRPDRLRFEAAEGTSLLVHGDYPKVQSTCVDPSQPVLHARYRGTIEVVRRPDGSLSLIGELAFEDYVKGIAEVPRDWPMEALKAQVVAARTYALNRLQSGTSSGDYDLCATTECQVYVGMEVEAGPWGDRWVQAVDHTAGQVLLYQGQPAITYYSSTSPGRTFDVEEVFGGQALPYLRGIEERDDGESPVSRWRVEVPFDDLARFLAADGRWGGGPIRSVDVSGGSIQVVGRTTASLSKDDLRDALNDNASCLAPDRYPTPGRTGNPLPSTVPSGWYRAQAGAGTLVLIGRGWGHGVGMVQWGAYGKAQRGLGYGDILAEYYGGLRPEPVEGPGTIRILVADGLREVTVAPSGETTVDAGGPVPDEPWVITGGARARIVQGEAPAPLLAVEQFRASRRVTLGEDYEATVTLSDDASVRLEFLDGDQAAATTDPQPFNDGTSRLAVALPDLTLGRYEVRAVASNGVDEVATEGQTVRVVEAETSSPEPSPSPAATRTRAAPVDGDEPSTPALIVGGAVAILVLVLLVLTARRRRGLHRG
jgi:SpoIID/LytB domain protein